MAIILEILDIRHGLKQKIRMFWEIRVIGKKVSRER